MVLTRSPEAGKLFYPGAAALALSFKNIFKILRQEVVRSRDCEQITDALDAAREKIPQLKILSEEIAKSMKLQKFDRRAATDPHGAVGNTADGVRISKIIRVARGLGFETRSGGAHQAVIDFMDGLPCALAESTNFGRDVRSRMARASGRSTEEIEELLETV